MALARVIVKVTGLTMEEFEDSVIETTDEDFEISDATLVSLEEDKDGFVTCKLFVDFRTNVDEEKIRDKLHDDGLPVDFLIDGRILTVLDEKFSSYLYVK